MTWVIENKTATPAGKVAVINLKVFLILTILSNEPLTLLTQLFVVFCKLNFVELLIIFYWALYLPLIETIFVIWKDQLLLHEACRLFHSFC